MAIEQAIAAGIELPAKILELHPLIEDDKLFAELIENLKGLNQ